MSIVVLVEFNSKPEDTNTLKQFMADALPDTRAYDGCITSMCVTAMTTS